LDPRRQLHTQGGERLRDSAHHAAGPGVRGVGHRSERHDLGQIALAAMAASGRMGASPGPEAKWVMVS
jgi:hypothetical protein